MGKAQKLLRILIHPDFIASPWATELETKDLSVTLAYGTDGPGGKGKIYIDTEEIDSIQTLTQRLSDEVRKQPELQLLVRSDARTDTARLVEILGIANSVGIKRLGIGARPFEGQQ